MIGSKGVDFFNRLTEKLKLLNRTAEDIQIVIVSKGRSIEEMKKALLTVERYGFRSVFGENYISELRSKLAYFPASMFHFIGRSHSNILRTIIRYGVFPQSVSSESQLAVVKSLDSKCFIQVNVSKDEKKAGFSLPEARAAYEKFKKQICGVMTILAANLQPETRKNLYSVLRAAFPGVIMSAGMSSDWEEALEAGSDMLRIGRLIFES